MSPERRVVVMCH